MGIRVRIFLLFLLLSILPFYGGGCGRITSGFPVPFIDMPDEIAWMEIADEFSAGGFFAPAGLFLANMLFVILMTGIVVRKEGSVKWLPLFVDALAVHVCFAWIFYCYFTFLMVVDVEPGGIWELIWGYPHALCVAFPDRIADKIIKLAGIEHHYSSFSPIGYAITDTVMRVWFLVLTAGIMGLMSAGGKMRNKLTKKGRRPL